MKTFQEWLADKHPEELDEGFMKNLALAGALAAGAAGAAGWAGGSKSNEPGRPTASQTQDQDDFDHEEVGKMSNRAKLRAAAQRVGIPKSQWGNLKGQMIGGVITSINGKTVPLTPKEASRVKAVQELGRRMGN